MKRQACEQLTLFQADSHVSRFPWQESKKVKGMSVTYGLKCCELSENLRRVGLSVRTYLESCELPPGTWCRIWSAKAITSRCLILKLRLLELRTDVNESRLLPTVRAQESGDYQYAHGDHNKKTLTLTGHVRMVERGIWPTPTASEANHAGPKSYYKSRSPHLTTAVLNGEHSGQLNPEWVEWLMGYPIGWTELNASETR